MIAFYAWWKSANSGNINEYHAYEGWREALKWVLRHEPSIGITGCIKEELKEKK